MAEAAPSWLLYACRTDYAAEVREILLRSGVGSVVLVDNVGEGDDATALLPGAVAPGQLSPAELALPAAVPLITPGHRHAVVAEALALGVVTFPTLVDPTAVVASTSTLGEGTVVNAGTVVAAETDLGRFVHVNRSASVGHHNVLEDYVTIGPGCILAGRVHLGAGAFVGAGAARAPQVSVGANSVVGAGAVVIADVPDGAVVVGNPARVIRTGGTGYGGVAVPR